MTSKLQSRSLLSFAPLATFTLLPVAILWVAYAHPRSQHASVITGACVLLVYIAFLLWKRRSELAAVVAVIPNVFGPLLTTLYVEHQVWVDPSAPSVPNLKDVLHSNGDLLIQMAFYFASLLGMALYLTQRIFAKKIEAKDIVSWLVFLAIVLSMITLNRDFFFKVWVVGTGFFPSVTPFFITRLLIALNAVALSTWPQNSNQTIR